MKDPYQVLGVSRDASEQEVTAAYRKLAKKYHPDLNPGDASAQKKMAEVNVAYEEIKSGRARYQDYSRPQAGQRQQGYNPYGGYSGFNPFEAFGFGWQQTAQHPKGRGLTCAIRPQKSKNLSAVNLKRRMVHCRKFPKLADQTGYLNINKYRP